MNLAVAHPDWLLREAALGQTFASEAERLRYAIELSRRNVLERTGGPFGAAVFECESGRLVAAGVNRVEALSFSAAHAEVMALLSAQERLATYDLGALGLPRHALVSSAQPCLMCAGAVLWSGVVRLVYAASKQDVERILGFDEGFLPRGWQRRLRRRGIAVSAGLLRQEARTVLELYRERGGTVYAARRGAGPGTVAQGGRVRRKG
jgi:tRNA(Arg) A34 adenosine deaminase TadA